MADVIEGKVEGDAAVNKILDAIIPSGIGPIFVRIKGVGKMMLSFHNADNDIEMLNVRSGEQETVTWDRLIETIKLPFPATKESWEHLYDEIFDKVEPIKQETETVNQTEPDTEAEESTDAAVEKVEAEIVTDPRKEEVKGLVRELSDSVNEERYSETISIAHTIASKVAQILVIERNKEDSNY